MAAKQCIVLGPVSRVHYRAIYVHGFEKKDVANISPDELEAFRKYAEVYFGYTSAEMAQLTEDGALFQVRKPEGEDNA